MRMFLMCSLLAVSGSLRCGPSVTPTARSQGPMPDAAAPSEVARPAPMVPNLPEPGVAPARKLEAASLEELPLDGFLSAVVAPPIGAERRQPVWVAAHGAGGKATFHCAHWRRMLPEGRGFVLCPRGFPTHPQKGVDAPGFYYDGHPRLADEVAVALKALAARWPEWVDLDAPVYAGYSQGASMGALALPGHPGRFARALFWEGGNGEHDEWNLRVARDLKAGGMRRVLFACGRSPCRQHAETSARYLAREGLEAQVIYVPGAGHTYGGELRERVSSRLDWLLEGDARWHDAPGRVSPSSRPWERTPREGSYPHPRSTSPSR